MPVLSFPGALPNAGRQHMKTQREDAVSLADELQGLQRSVAAAWILLDGWRATHGTGDDRLSALHGLLGLIGGRIRHVESVVRGADPQPLLWIHNSTEPEPRKHEDPDVRLKARRRRRRS